MSCTSSCLTVCSEIVGCDKAIVVNVYSVASEFGNIAWGVILNNGLGPQYTQRLLASDW